MQKEKIEIDSKLKTLKKLVTVSGVSALCIGLYVIFNRMLPVMIRVPASWLPVMLAVYAVLGVSCIVTHRQYLKLKRKREEYL